METKKAARMQLFYWIYRGLLLLAFFAIGIFIFVYCYR